VGEIYGAGGFMSKLYKDQFDQIFNFELANGFVSSSLSGTNLPVNSAIKFSLKDQPDFDFATFLTNHDQNRVMTQLNGDVQKAKLAAFLLLTTPGTPYIYYGEEIGMSGQKPDEDIRLPMQWDSTQNAGFSQATPWRAPNADYQTVNVFSQQGEVNSLFDHYRKLILIRRDHPVLSRGTVKILETGNSAVFAMLLRNESETLLIAANLKDVAISDYELHLDGNDFAESVSGVDMLFGQDQAQVPERGGEAPLRYKPYETLRPYQMFIINIKQ
jgi:glycosidase